MPANPHIPTITECQAALVRHGYSVGKYGVDGLGGRDTQAAILKFQADNGLPKSGQFDQATVNLLFRKDYPMDTVLANVKSAWLSKLNWTLGVGALFNLFAVFGLQVPSDVKDSIMAVGNGLVIIVAWVIKTWFTTSISAASAKKL